MERRNRRNSYLLVLLVILAFNFADRSALGIAQESIKADLHLTDTQLGFLSGISFALFYSVMGIPIARWADRGDRVVIISLCAAVWSAMVALCGAVSGFSQLLAIRVGVGIGEAGCVPPAHSLLADYFPRSERPRAAAIYALGGPFSFVIGFLIAGWVNQYYGWRIMFVAVGAPGVVLAALAYLVLHEPRRGRVQGAQSTDGSRILQTAAPSLKTVFVTLYRNTSFRYLLLSYSGMYLFGYGMIQWQPTYFVRTYGLSSGEVGTWLALVYGVGGAVGTYLGGVLASRYAPNNERLQLRALAASISLYGSLSIAVYFVHSPYLAFGLIGVSNLLMYTMYGPLYALIQTLVADNMRAMSIALVYFVANFVGLGLGPLIAGGLSDALRPIAGDESLRYALIIITPGFLIVGWCLWQASKSVVADLKTIGAAAETELTQSA